MNDGTITTLLPAEAELVKQAEAKAEMQAQAKQEILEKDLADGWREIRASRYFALVEVRYGDAHHNPASELNHHRYEGPMEEGQEITWKCNGLYWRRCNIPGDANSGLPNVWQVSTEQRTVDIV